MEEPFYKYFLWQMGDKPFFFWGGGRAGLHGGLMMSHAKDGGVSQMHFPVTSKLYNLEIIFGNPEEIYT